jgi:hypothetical protein
VGAELSSRIDFVILFSQLNHLGNIKMEIRKMAGTPTNKVDKYELNQEGALMMIQIKHKGLEETISGTPEQVYLFLKKFFEDLLPSFEIAEKLTLHSDLETLTKESKNLIAFAGEGPYVLVPRSKLTDNEMLALLLLANHLGRKLGKTKTDGLSKEELQAKLGKDAKITGTRLGELVKSEVAIKTVDEKFRITTFGLVQMQKDILPRIRAKTVK